MYTFDHDLFMALNFDGGRFLDNLMLAISGLTMWIPLYILILWLVWRREGWRTWLIFVVLMLVVLGLSDMIAGIFKHSGLLKDMLPDFTPRPRPMFTPAFEGLDITPDSLRALRWAAPSRDWAVHVPPEAVSGLNGTVSGHAATIVSLAVFSCSVIRRRWFTWLMVICTILICYSRIYLGKHFPMDLLWGSLVGAVLGYAAYWCYRRLTQKREPSY